MKGGASRGKSLGPLFDRLGLSPEGQRSPEGLWLTAPLMGSRSWRLAESLIQEAVHGGPPGGAAVNAGPGATEEIVAQGIIP